MKLTASQFKQYLTSSTLKAIEFPNMDRLKGLPKAFADTSNTEITSQAIAKRESILLFSALNFGSIWEGNGRRVLKHHGSCCQERGLGSEIYICIKNLLGSHLIVDGSASSSEISRFGIYEAEGLTYHSITL